MTSFQENLTSTQAKIGSTSEFDAKFQILFDQNVNKKDSVQSLKDDMFSDWRKHIAFGLKLEEEQPSSAKTVTKIVNEATKQAKKLSVSGRPPIEIMENLKKDLKSKIQNKFQDFSEEYTDQVADFIVSSLVGTCPLDWR